MQRLAQAVGRGLVGRLLGDLRGQLVGAGVGPEVDPETGRPVLRNGLAERRRQGVDRTALQPVAGDHRLAPHPDPAEGDRHAFQRLALEAVAEHLAPGHVEAAVGGAQRAHRHAIGGEDRGPGSVGAEPGPAGAAKGQDRGVGLGGHLTVRRGEAQAPLRIPTLPVVAGAQLNALTSQPGKPGAEQGRRLQSLGEDAPRRAHEGGLSQALRPGDRGRRWKGFDRGGQPSGRGAIARQKRLKRFGVGQVQSAAPGHQQLAADRRHAVVDGDRAAGAGQYLGGHQTRRPAPDDGDGGGGIQAACRKLSTTAATQLFKASFRSAGVTPWRTSTRSSSGTQTVYWPS